MKRDIIRRKYHIAAAGHMHMQGTGTRIPGACEFVQAYVLHVSMHVCDCVCVHVSVYECSVPPPWISSSFHAEKGWKMLTLCQIVTQSLASLPELLPVALQTGCDGNAGANRLVTEYA